MLEIQYEADLQAGHAEIIQHPPDFVIGDALDGLGIHDDFSENDQIGNILPDLAITVMDREAGLLDKRNAQIPELNNQGLFIRLFMEPMPQRVRDGERISNDPFRFQNMNPISSICVHPIHLWLIFFMLAAARRVR